MFKIPTVLPSGGHMGELADWAEAECLRSGSMSVTELSRTLLREHEPDHSDGVEEENPFENDLAEGLHEIADRGTRSGSGHPFSIDASGYVLRYDGSEALAHKNLAYCFMLFATRLNMQSDRTHADEDGTALLEHLSSVVARDYWGSRAESYVFGTAAGSGGFAARIDDLCEKTGEGGGFRNVGGGQITSQDGKLDVVVWKPFSDRRRGQAMGFGQCKSGTLWEDNLLDLWPDKFYDRWIDMPHPPFDPTRLFFVAESIDRSRWYPNVLDGGLVFDRCRMVDYLPSPTDGHLAGLIPRILSWTSAVAEKHGYHYLRDMLNAG